MLLSLIGIFLFSFVSADTTFFEGDYNYRGDFIMANLPEEIIEAVRGGVEILPSGGGGYFLKEEFNSTLVCEICSESLREHIKQYQNIDYSEEKISILTSEINQEFQIDLSNNQVRYIIENFEDECDSNYPLFSGFAGGRLRNLTTPALLTISFFVLAFFIIIGFMIIRSLKKRGYGRTWKIKKRKRNK